LDARCARRLIRVGGTILGEREADHRLEFSTNPEPYAESLPVEWSGSDFRATVLFDRTARGGRGGKDNCSRVPRFVYVRLYRGSTLLKSCELTVAKDFVRDNDGNYSVRVPLRIDAR
jgi:hypothetical protein